MVKIPIKERTLNDEQKKAVTFGQDPLLIIAGAGTGKTTVVTERIKHLITSGKANPQEILALTFTEKASREMEERVDVALPYGTTQMWISTFHAFCDRILRNEAINIGLDPAFKLMTEAETILFFRKNLFKFELKYYRPLGNPTKFISGMLQHFSRLKDEDVDPRRYLTWVNSKSEIRNPKQIQNSKLKILNENKEENEKYQELAHAYRTYEELKVKEGVADYSDLISNTLKLFRTRKNVLQRYQEQFKYILIDEFQDTNFAQNELAILLAGERKNITVVGDDDQCLHGGAFVLTPNGEKKIKQMKEGDEVLTAVGKGRLGISTIRKVMKSKKKTLFVTIKTKSGKTITATQNHIMFCYVPKSVKNKEFHYVYLMHRKNLGWRLGVTNDLAVRLKLERSADGIIGIRAFKKETDARYYELLWSLQYQIPTSIFKERDGVIMQGEVLKKIYRNFDTQQSAYRLAADLGINLTHYHYLLDGVTRGQSKRVVVHVNLCYRNYTSKVKTGKILLRPKILHCLYLETSNKDIIAKLANAGIPIVRAKKGIRVRKSSINLQEIEEYAKRIAQITDGFIEAKSNIGKLNLVHLPTLLMPAGNLLEGHFVPIVKNRSVFYDQIVKIERREDEDIVYDLEIDKTHNFIANDFVVHNSIYRFRGAAISNIHQFKQQYPKGQIIVLTKNYRSTKEILDRSHELIQHNNPDRLEAAENIEKKLESVRRVNGEAIGIIYTNRVENEAEEVAGEVKRVKEKGESENRNGREWSDFAILVRANNHAEPFIRAFSRAGIPYQFLGPGQLFRQPEIKDLIAYLKVLYNFEDNVAMYRVLNMDWTGVSARETAVLMNESRKYGTSLFEACEKSSIDTIRKLVSIIHRHMGFIKKETAGQILYYFLEDTGMLQKITLYKTTKEERIAGNIAKFFNKLKAYEIEHDDASVFAVVDWIDLSMSLGESPLATDTDWTENNAVNILTIHSAKGLEFPVVFLVNLVSARFPTIERKEQIPIPDELIKEILPEGDFHMQEERRLFYVGMTRARDLLYFTGAKYYGEAKREKKLSPFVAETIGENEASKHRSIEASSYTNQLTFLDWEKKEEKEEKPVRQLISYLSYSQLDTFKTCPLQYKYRYVLKIPVPPSAALTFGNTMHRVVKAFYDLARSGEHPTKEMLLNLFDSHWSSIGFGDKGYEEKMKKQGRELLLGFFEKGYDPEKIPRDLEQPFKIKVTPTLTLGGRIDRVDDLEDGKIEIIDYKTGQAPKNRDVREDFQLTVYALAATDAGIYDKPPEKVTVSFYFFEGQEKVQATRGKEQLEQAKKEIARKAEEISRSEFKPTPGKHCDFCEFRLICEAWQ